MFKTKDQLRTASGRLRIDHPVLWWATLAIVAAYWIAILAWSSVNPMGDDFDVALKFLHRFLNAPSFSDQIQLLFSPHNEHRLVTLRLFLLLEYGILHVVNFPALIIIGNLGWTLAFFFAVKIIIRPIQDPWARASSVLVTALLFFSWRHSEIMVWPVGSIQQYWQIAFTLGAVHFVTSSTRIRSLVLGLVFGVLATFTGASGVAVFVVLALTLFLGKNPGRGWVALAVGLLAGLTYYVLLPGVSLPGSRHATNGAVSWGIRLMVFVSCLGATAPRLKLAVLLGAVILVLTVFLAWRRPRDTRLALVFLAFVTAGAVAVARSETGLLVGITSEYSMYSLLALSALFGIGAPWLVRRSKVLASLSVVAVVGLSVFLCLNTFGYLRDLHLRTESGSMNYDKVTAGREILDSASREGVFPDSRLRPDTYDTLQPLGPARIGVDALAVANGHLTVTGWAADSGGRLLARAVVLTVDGYPYRVMNYGFERQDIEHSTGLPLMKFSGFEDSVDLSKLAPGTHGYEFEVVAFDGRSAGAGPRGQFSIP